MIRQWGDIWEEKIKVQDEVGVIHGTIYTTKRIKKQLQNDFNLFDK